RTPSFLSQVLVLFSSDHYSQTSGPVNTTLKCKNLPQIPLVKRPFRPGSPAQLPALRCKTDHPRPSAGQMDFHSLLAEFLIDVRVRLVIGNDSINLGDTAHDGEGGASQLAGVDHDRHLLSVSNQRLLHFVLFNARVGQTVLQRES